MKSKKFDIWKELELGLGSGSKFRVILTFILNHNKTLTKYALMKHTKLRKPSVDSQIKSLAELGWIKEYNFTPKTYEINLENATVNLLFKAFKVIKDVRFTPKNPTKK